MATITCAKRRFEFAQVAVTLALQYPEAKTIHLVMDNLNIHHRKSLGDVFGADMAAEVWNRFTVHYTPTHRRMNRDRVKINWTFNRKAARHKFGYKRKAFKRSQT